MPLVPKTAPLHLVAVLLICACSSAAPERPEKKFAPEVEAREGVEQNFELQVAVGFEIPSTDGCADEVRLGIVEATVQDGLSQPVKSGFVSATVWTCVPGVDGLVVFGGTAPLDGDLYSDLPTSATLSKTLTVTDFHFSESQALQPPFDLTVDLTLTGFGDITWVPPETTVLDDGTVVESVTAWRDASVAGSTQSSLPGLSITIDPSRGSALASGYWATSSKDGP